MFFFLTVGVFGLHISFQIHASIRRHGEYSMCGRPPTCWTAMCFDYLSANTVKYMSQIPTVTACYIPQRLPVLT